MKNISNPTISVIIPCYNSESTIERCLHSVMSQTLLPQEILIYNDGSTDRTVDKLEKLSTLYESIRVINSTINSGAGVARTSLLKAATGNYIAFLDADDVWFPEKLKIQIELMDAENADICVCGYEILSVDNKRIGARIPPKKINLFRMHLTDWIPTSMTVIREGLIGGNEMPSIRRRQDYAYWLQIFQKNPAIKCVTVSSVHGYYYRMPNSLSSSWKKNLRSNFEMFRSTLGYSTLASTFFVLINAMVRVFRK